MLLSIDIQVMNQVMLFILLFLLCVLVGIIIAIFVRIFKNLKTIFTTVNEITEDVNGKVKQLDGIFNAFGKVSEAFSKSGDRSPGLFGKIFSRKSKNKEAN